MAIDECIHHQFNQIIKYKACKCWEWNTLLEWYWKCLPMNTSEPQRAQQREDATQEWVEPKTDPVISIYSLIPNVVRPDVGHRHLLGKGSVTNRWLGWTKAVWSRFFPCNTHRHSVKKLKYWGDTSPRPPRWRSPCSLASIRITCTKHLVQYVQNIKHTRTVSLYQGPETIGHCQLTFNDSCSQSCWTTPCGAPGTSTSI